MQFPFASLTNAIYNTINGTATPTGPNNHNTDNTHHQYSGSSSVVPIGNQFGYGNEEDLIGFESDDDSRTPEMSMNPVTTKGPLDSTSQNYNNDDMFIPPALPLVDMSKINVIRPKPPSQAGSSSSVPQKHQEYYGPSPQVCGAGLIPEESASGAAVNGGTAGEANSAGGTNDNASACGGTGGNGGNGGSGGTGGAGDVGPSQENNPGASRSQHPPPPPGFPARPDQVAQPQGNVQGGNTQAYHQSAVQNGPLLARINLLETQNKQFQEQLQIAQAQANQPTKLNKTTPASKKDYEFQKQRAKQFEKDVVQLTQMKLKLEKDNHDLVSRLETCQSRFAEYVTGAEAHVERLKQDLTRAYNKHERLNNETDIYISTFTEEIRNLKGTIRSKEQQISQLSADIAKISNQAPDAVRDDHYLSGKLGNVFLAIQNFVVSNFMRGRHDDEVLEVLEGWVKESFAKIVGEEAWKEAVKTDHVVAIKALVSYEVVEHVMKPFLCGLPEVESAFQSLMEAFSCDQKQFILWRTQTVTMLAAHPTFSERLDARLQLLATRLDEGLSPLANRAKSTPTRVKKLKAVLHEAALISIECQKEPSEFRYLRAALNDPCNSDTMIDASGTMEGDTLNQQAGVRMVVTPGILRRAFEGRAEEVLIIKAQVLVHMRVTVKRKGVPKPQSEAPQPQKNQQQDDASAAVEAQTENDSTRGPIVEVDPEYNAPGGSDDTGGVQLSSTTSTTSPPTSTQDADVASSALTTSPSPDQQTETPSPPPIPLKIPLASPAELALKTLSPDSQPTPPAGPAPIEDIVEGGDAAAAVAAAIAAATALDITNTSGDNGGNGGDEPEDTNMPDADAASDAGGADGGGDGPAETASREVDVVGEGAGTGTGASAVAGTGIAVHVAAGTEGGDGGDVSMGGTEAGVGGAEAGEEGKGKNEAAENGGKKPGAVGDTGAGEVQ